MTSTRSDQLAASERDKYRRMWAVEDYSANSPGEKMLGRAVQMLGMTPSHSINDYGCGTMRAVDAMRRLGYDALGFDLVPLRDDVIGTCLWSMGAEVRASDWGYCCDVMEHIPPEMVGEALDAIALRCERGAFFGICTRADDYGARIGEVLHLTVQPAEWWAEMLADRFSSVETGPTYLRGASVSFACHHSI